MTRAAYHFTGCLHHPGRNTYNHPCEHRNKDGTVCGWQQPKPKLEPGRPALSLVTSEKEGEPLETVKLSEPQREVDVQTNEIVGDESGELLECTVSGDLFGVAIPKMPVDELPGYMAGVMREGRNVDPETGEITGQLMLPGLPAISRVPVTYKPYWEMTRREFNTHDWRLEEDDRMAVKVKDGAYQVTVTRKGVQG